MAVFPIAEKELSVVCTPEPYPTNKPKHEWDVPFNRLLHLAKPESYPITKEV